MLDLRICTQVDDLGNFKKAYLQFNGKSYFFYKEQKGNSLLYALARLYRDAQHAGVDLRIQDKVFKFNSHIFFQKNYLENYLLDFSKFCFENLKNQNNNFINDMLMGIEPAGLAKILYRQVDKRYTNGFNFIQHLLSTTFLKIKNWATKQIDNADIALSQPFGADYELRTRRIIVMIAFSVVNVLVGLSLQLSLMSILGIWVSMNFIGNRLNELSVQDTQFKHQFSKNIFSNLFLPRWIGRFKYYKPKLQLTGFGNITVEQNGFSVSDVNRSVGLIDKLLSIVSGGDGYYFKILLKHISFGRLFPYPLKTSKEFSFYECDIQDNCGFKDAKQEFSRICRTALSDYNGQVSFFEKSEDQLESDELVKLINQYSYNIRTEEGFTAFSKTFWEQVEIYSHLHDVCENQPLYVESIPEHYRLKL